MVDITAYTYIFYYYIYTDTYQLSVIYLSVNCDAIII